MAIITFDSISVCTQRARQLECMYVQEVHVLKYSHSCFELLFTEINHAAIFNRQNKCHDLLLNTNKIHLFTLWQPDIRESLKYSDNSVPSLSKCEIDWT